MADSRPEGGESPLFSSCGVRVDELLQDSVVVHEQGLRNWLSECWYAGIPPDSTPSEAPLQSISNAEILCEHNKLDPDKAGDMKIVPQVRSTPRGSITLRLNIRT